jgi:hypothetical protein
VRLPHETDACLFLIGEELKSRTLFRAFHSIGLDDCFFQPHLDSIILRMVGLDSSDATFARYNDIMDKRAEKIEACRESIAKQAFKAYHELRQLRKKLRNATAPE